MRGDAITTRKDSWKMSHVGLGQHTVKGRLESWPKKVVRKEDENEVEDSLERFSESKQILQLERISGEKRREQSTGSWAWNIFMIVRPINEFQLKEVEII